MTSAVPTWAVSDRWTNRQMLDACLENVRAAAQEEGQLRAIYHSLAPGDARLIGDKTHPPIGLQVQRAIAEQRHWRREVAYWRARCVEEGEDARPPSKFQVKAAAKAPISSYIDDPKLDGDPVVEKERTQRREAQQATKPENGELPF